LVDTTYVPNPEKYPDKNRINNDKKTTKELLVVGRIYNTIG